MYVMQQVKLLDQFEIEVGGKQAEEIVDVLVGIALALDFVATYVTTVPDDAVIVGRFWRYFAPGADGAALPRTWREFSATLMRSLVLSAYKNIYHVLEEVAMDASPAGRRVRAMRRAYICQLKDVMDGKEAVPGDAVVLSPAPTTAPHHPQSRGGVWRALAKAVPEAAVDPAPCSAGEAGHKRPHGTSSSTSSPLSSSSSSSSGPAGKRRARPSKQTAAILHEMSAFLGDDSGAETEDVEDGREGDGDEGAGAFYFSTCSGGQQQHPKKRLLRRRFRS